MSLHYAAVQDLIRRIPVLRELRGAARIEAEVAISNAFDDAIEAYLAEAEMVSSSGGAP